MTGHVPEARALHSMAVVGDKLYVYGGLGVAYGDFPDLILCYVAD